MVIVKYLFHLCGKTDGQTDGQTDRQTNILNRVVKTSRSAKPLKRLPRGNKTTFAKT